MEKPPEKKFNEFSEKITILELKPEILEMVMTKVEDINSKGTAFTDTTIMLPSYHKEEVKKRLKKILTYGLLGSIESTEPTPQNWKEYSKRKKQGVVFFNIIGRSCLENYIYTGKPNRDLVIKSMYQILDDRLFGRNRKHIFIIIDLNGYQEIWMPKDIKLKNIEHPCHNPYSIQQKTHTFYADFIHQLPDSLKRQFGNKIPPPGSQELKQFAQTPEGKLYLDEDGFPLPTTEFGFVLAHRVAPRRFKGIVLYIPPEEYIQQDEQLINLVIPPMPPSTIIQKEVAWIVSLMLEVNKNKPQNLIPIYYINGDLIWPKQMTYEEVKKFIKNRK